VGRPGFLMRDFGGHYTCIFLRSGYINEYQKSTHPIMFGEGFYDNFIFMGKIFYYLASDFG
jgi:hypothetical protein